MKILSIGNSFSQDAQRYLHRLALREGVQMKTVNTHTPTRKPVIGMEEPIKTSPPTGLLVGTNPSAD